MKNKIFLEEAVRIGDNILSRKKENKNGLFWETMFLDHSDNIKWKVSESIYSGVGGIVLFFLELYKHTQEKKYWEATVKGADWLIDYIKKNPTSYYAFYTGRMGISHVLVEVYRLTNEHDYLREATRNAFHCTDFLDHPSRVDDLINGTSGTLLGLLLLHQESRDENLLPMIEKFINQLLQKVHLGHQGLYWDKNTGQISGLCGFSHGAAGVGYVFLQLGIYFDNPTFYWLAEQSFLYENYFFDEQTGNWPDLRKGIFTEENFQEHKEAYISKDKNFFFKPGNMMAWCHGAPGIGLSRVHGWLSINKDYLKFDLENAMEVTQKITLSSLSLTDTFTLCHGKGGNAMLFLENHKKLYNVKAKDLAQKVALQALEHRNFWGYYKSGFHNSTIEEDTSLFMGNAGIGYFYLMCMSPNNIPSILSPSIEKACKVKITSSFDILNLQLPQIQKDLLFKAYPKTIEVLKDNQLLDSRNFSRLEHLGISDLKSTFENNIKQLAYNCDHPECVRVQSIFEMEKMKLELELNSNPALLNIKSKLLKEEVQNLLSLTKENLMQLMLKLNDDSTIVEFMDKPSQMSSNQHDDKNQQAIVLYCTPYGVNEYYISTFTQEILKAFSKPRMICEVKEDFLHSFDLNLQIDISKFEDLFIDQIKECIRSLFLITT